MNVKTQIGEVIRVIDKTKHLDQIYNIVHPIALEDGIYFAEPQPGPGCVRWSLPGDNWKSLGALSEEEKKSFAAVYDARIQSFRSRISGLDKVSGTLCGVPSIDFIYVRNRADKYEIALVAWGHKYPNRPVTDELSSSFIHQALQAVKIGFTWNGNPVPSFPFKLDTYPRSTSADGYFCSDGPLPVGSIYNLQTVSDRQIGNLVVEAGKEEYVFDLTSYITVSVRVTDDSKSVAGEQVVIQFGEDTFNLVTDDGGHCSVRIPLGIDMNGELIQPQPPCEAACRDKKQAKTPTNVPGILNFDFYFVADPVPVPEPNPEPNPEPTPLPDPEQPPLPEPDVVKIQLLDYEGYPLPDMPFILQTKKGDISLYTDSKGESLVPKESFIDREKIKVKFKVTKEYQRTHNIHANKRK